MQTESGSSQRAPLVVAAAAWAFGALVLGALTPLRGGPAATAAVVVALLLVPGLLLSLALQLHRAWTSVWSGVLSATALGGAAAFALAGAARALGAPVESAASALVALGLMALAAIGWRARPGSPEPGGGFDGLRGRGALEWAADAAVALGGLALAAPYARWIEPAMPSGALWYYLSYIEWMAEQPGLSYEPHSVDPEEWNPRLQASGFLAFEALVSRLVRVDANALQVFWSWLPLTLLPLLLAAPYALAASLGTGARTRLAVVGLELLLIYATFGYALDRETSGIRWPGAVSLLRISQDKVFLAFLLAPAAAMFGAEWLARGQRRWLVAWAIAGVACVLTHPLGLPFLAMVSLPFAALSALVGATPWRRVTALALLLLPLAVWPWSQRAAEGAPASLADDAGFARRAHLTRDSLSITSRERNEYTAHPSLLAHPLLAAGAVCGFALLPAVRRRSDARYAFAATAAPLVMLYTPGVAPLAGQLVTPYLLWRFTWLLPVALSLAVAGRTLCENAEAARPRSGVWAGAGLAAAFTLALSPLADLWRSAETLATLRPAPISAADAGPLVAALAAQTDERTVLLDPTLQPLALSLAPGLRTGYWRAGSHPERYAAVVDLFGSASLAPRHLDLLRDLEVAWLVVDTRSALREGLALHPEWFAPAGRVETLDLLEVRGLAGAQLPADPVAAWRERVRAEPGALRARNGLVLALLAAGQRAEAREALTELLQVDERHAPSHERLGTLLLAGPDPARALAHLRRSLELDPGRSNAHNNLAWVLATSPDPALRDPAAALEHARALLALGPPDAGALDTIAAAQAASGDFAGAVRSARQAVALYESGGIPPEAWAGVRERLAGYQAAQPFVDVAD